MKDAVDNSGAFVVRAND